MTTKKLCRIILETYAILIAETVYLLCSNANGWAIFFILLSSQLFFFHLLLPKPFPEAFHIVKLYPSLWLEHIGVTEYKGKLYHLKGATVFFITVFELLEMSDQELQHPEMNLTERKVYLIDERLPNKEEAVNEIIKATKLDTNKISDGYHTFEELYDSRIELYIALCKKVSETTHGRIHPVWRSTKHSDGTEYDGWFLLGIGTAAGKQITFHLPINRWPDTMFARTFTIAPDFDGHTTKDVLQRLKEIC